MNLYLSHTVFVCFNALKSFIRVSPAFLVVPFGNISIFTNEFTRSSRNVLRDYYTSRKALTIVFRFARIDPFNLNQKSAVAAGELRNPQSCITMELSLKITIIGARTIGHRRRFNEEIELTWRVIEVRAERKVRPLGCRFREKLSVPFLRIRGVVVEKV